MPGAVRVVLFEGERGMIFHGDCLEVLRTLPDNSVDAVVTDPPYGLSFMGKRWDYDAPSVDVWAECLRVLKPGGHLLAFAGTRTQHRMAVRIEDAGFEIRDMIAWVYGSGFPKSLDVSKAIDKAAGAEREVVGYDASRARPNKEGYAKVTASVGERGGNAGHKDNGATITAPATEAAHQWQGWGTALKPALEPITVARKPLATCATNVLQMVESQLRDRGVRGEILWKPENASGAAKSKKTPSLDSTRHSGQSATFAKTADESATPSVGQQSPKSSEQLGTNGQNQTTAGSESFHGCTTSGCANPSSQPMEVSAPAAGSESVISSPSTTSTEGEHSTASKFTGKSTPNCGERGSRPDTESFAGIATGLTGSMETVRISRDSEGFFLWPMGLPKFVPGSPLTVAENVLVHSTGALNIDGCRVGDTVETWPATRSYAPGQMQPGGMGETQATGKAPPGRWPANLIHDGSDEVVAGFPDSNGQQGKTGKRKQGVLYNAVDEGEAGIEPRGDTGSAARFFYCAKASKRDRDDGNHHPTVKPTDLMRYLCRLVTPPGGVVLDPFMGSGSTGKAAVLEGFQFIGIERDAEYLEIARARINAVQPNLL